MNMQDIQLHEIKSYGGEIAEAIDLINTIPIQRVEIDEATGNQVTTIVDYVTVNERLKAYRRVFPISAIITEYELDDDGYVMFKAAIHGDNGELLATGHARRLLKDNGFELCETKAVGKALALAGFNKSSEIASVEEIKESREEKKEEDEQLPSDKINKAIKPKKAKSDKVTKNQLKRLDEMDEDFLEDCLNKLNKPIERLTVEEANQIIERYEAIR